ncbi:MAG: hypothetical protein LBK95_04625 [Bifidobacteriaceae bacterium]|nr:hypothetical protein [Bifidobacteriaceae bacterium]
MDSGAVAGRAEALDWRASRALWGMVGVAAYIVFVIALFTAAGGPCASPREASSDACVFAGGNGLWVIVVGQVAVMVLARRAGGLAGVAYGAGIAYTVWSVIASAGFLDSRYAHRGSWPLLALGIVGAAGMGLAVKVRPGRTRHSGGEPPPRHGPSLMARGAWVASVSAVAGAVLWAAGPVWLVTSFGIVAGVVMVLAGSALRGTDQSATTGAAGGADETDETERDRCGNGGADSIGRDGANGNPDGRERQRAVILRIVSLAVGVPATIVAGFFVLVFWVYSDLLGSGGGVSGWLQEAAVPVGWLLVALNLVVGRVARTRVIVVYAVAVVSAVFLPYLSSSAVDVLDVFWPWALGVVGLIGTAFGVRPLRPPGAEQGAGRLGSEPPPSADE